MSNRPEWMDQAVCQSVDPEIFFPEKGSRGVAVKKVCSTCPVRRECITYALVNHEHEGIWGCTTTKRWPFHFEVSMGRLDLETAVDMLINDLPLASQRI